MTFEHAESITTTAPPAAVWALWSDVGSWHLWDPAVEAVALEGSFGEGAGGTMTLTGGTEAPFVVEVVEPGSRYLDRLTMGDLAIEIDHVVVPAGDGAEITVTTRVTGPGAEDVGPMVTRDAPVALERLVALAQGA
ncbi:SRPBCC family protein [Nocardioides marmotae]|uniref:Polyketide cyclase n=1 Tax=Nocardioides marmotae TaxID=2663857 RepID=A0A6I3JD14_9ACTN|nr:SRPBCC family protein [Nocardioides marmotae]MCR6032334.1 hypothetical protein [Gordonia jinghuaiqii]MBC9735630.1 SRPBCC family protein [Nocardioides marmotae]MTB86726.1 hypothetical protein [Nocardioides marmotae]MTB95982.1 hypothetical protein [Nocardioides marmotae]QKE02689.1 hypothetical protein HPC71_17620 [Nocardioides marmotae]